MMDASEAYVYYEHPELADKSKIYLRIHAIVDSNLSLWNLFLNRQKEVDRIVKKLEDFLS